MFLRILLLIVGVSSDVPGKIKQYECGEHGRFEYCVDGVPGCVVGCHCHPGYYFDTETKICEPNTKLVQDYRRHFLAEPTRVQLPITPAYEIEITPTLSTKSPLDNQVDQALAKDTDDIGDWLYNQFFKTIENQVLSANNNTDNSNTDANNQTRRAGTGPSQKKTKRKKVTPKKIKFSKISKKDDLRRKLLRITEDDSLFDSDSRSRSRSTEDSKSSSNSDSSDTSLESDNDCNGDDNKNRKDKNKSHTNDKEHGHRKILVVKKKPKPPLPSFIFLPNLETPFFPPIGLPPPPPLPMYPMVPVPPMPLPPFPFTMVVTTESNDKTKASKKTTHSQKHTTTEPNKTDKPEHSTEHTTTSEATGDKNSEKPDQAVIENSDKLSLRSRMLKRKKLLRQFREKHPGPFIPFDHRKSMKHEPPINPLMPSANDYMDMEDMMEEMTRPPPPGPPPVDFKYLSQLIHKMNPNISNAEVKKKVALPQRRFQTQYYHNDPEVAAGPLPPPPNELSTTAQPHEGDDSYYANLGQQIASLIRRLDNAQPQTNSKSPSTHEGIINGDNNFASRSYWERSVRSLFSHYPPNSNDINFLKNEENLLNLENKVKVVATTQRSWNLNDLENVISLADRIKSQIDNIKMKKIQDDHKQNLAKQTNLKNIEPLKSLKAEENLNINLLPRHTDMLLGEKKESSIVSGRRNIQQSQITVTTNETKNKTVNPLEELINRQSIHYNLRGILLQNFKNIFQKSDSQKQPMKYVNHNGTNVNHKTIMKPMLEGTSLRKLIRMDQLQSLRQNKSLRPKVKPKAKPRPKHDGSSERFLSTVNVLTKSSADIQQLNAMTNYKNTPLHSSHHNKYIFENDALAFQLSPALTQQERAYYQVPHHHNYFD